MSDSVRPHRRQPTRLLCPWDSPGKNTGVDCHFLLQCIKVKSESEVAQSCPTLSDPMDCSLPGSSVHGIFQARVLEWGAIAFSAPSPSAAAAAAAAKSLQSCPTLWDPIDSSLPGSAIPGILQVRILEWVAISFSNAWKWKVKVKSLSRVWLVVTPWIAAYQAPPSMGFSKQEYWSGVPLLSPLQVHLCYCKWQNFVLLWLSSIPLYISTSSLSIHLLMDTEAASTSRPLQIMLLWTLGAYIWYPLKAVIFLTDNIL